MKEGYFSKNTEKSFLITIFNQKHRELLLQYQILTTALFSASIGFAIEYATDRIESTSPNKMIFFSILYDLIGFIGITILFNKYFKEIKYKILIIGESYA